MTVFARSLFLPLVSTGPCMLSAQSIVKRPAPDTFVMRYGLFFP